MQRLKPRKSLGQHFLTDKNIARNIVTALSAKDCRSIVEIGPGTGVLTSLLTDRFDSSVHFVEVDREAVKVLAEAFPAIKDRILNYDILKLDLERHFQAPVAIIGNLPYNISSQIFFKILDNRNIVNEVVCMVQKEVARRIAAPPGNKEYGILSVLLQAYYSIEYLFTVPPGVFYPPPKVNSGVIRLIRNDTHQLSCDEKKFLAIVKASFNQRRKMLRNSLHNHFTFADPEDPLMSKRPEQLSVKDFIDLTNKAERV